MADLPKHQCSTCKKEMAWIVRPAGGSVPLDTRAVVYFVGLSKDGTPVAKTAKEFWANVRLIQLQDGREITPDKIMGPFVTHFATCPQASQHSRK